MKQICRIVGSFNNGNLLGSISLLQRLRLSYSTSSSIKDEGNPNCSFAELLVESLGFSKRQSLSTCAKIVERRIYDPSKLNTSKTVSNAHSVIQFFLHLGFQKSEIRKLASTNPGFLCCKIEKTLKPKIELLTELGFSGSDLTVAISRNPFLLYRHFGPIIHTLRIVLGSDENVVAFLKKSFSYMWTKDTQDSIIGNVELLRNCYGIPTEMIRKFVVMLPNLFLRRTDLFRDCVVRVEHKLGIPRHSPNFFYAIHSLSSCPEKKLEDIIAVFKNFGWTQSDVMALLRRDTSCLTLSAAMIEKKLGFLMNQLDYKPDNILLLPALLCYSFEKRLLPRHRVLQALKEKRLCKKDHRLTSVVVLTESVFLKRFVLPFEEVHQLYEQLTGCKLESDTAEIARGKLQPSISDLNAPS